MKNEGFQKKEIHCEDEQVKYNKDMEEKKSMLKKSEELMAEFSRLELFLAKEKIVGNEVESGTLMRTPSKDRSIKIGKTKEKGRRGLRTPSRNEAKSEQVDKG